jgi:hypothetical protein
MIGGPSIARPGFINGALVDHIEVLDVIYVTISRWRWYRLVYEPHPKTSR